jgi:uncharacterized protein
VRKYIADNIGKIVIIELERGEKIIETVEATLKELGIHNAYIASGIGSVQRLCYHKPTSLSAQSEDIFIDETGAFEFGGIAGTVINGVAHFHFTIADMNGVHAGHLEYGTEVLYLAEITLVEMPGFALERRLTDENVKKLFEI